MDKVQISVPFIGTHPTVTAQQVIGLLDEAHVQAQAVDVANWATDYPYQPVMRFRMAHTGTHLLIHYYIEEETVRAVAEADQGRVWEDSCCEFFFSPDANEHYYNFECNAAGRLLLHYGIHGRRTPATTAVLQSIDRWSSCGTEPFEEKTADDAWQLCLVIPATALFAHRITAWGGIRATANVYKCGDKLTKPHFLSLTQIDINTPCFHAPQFFAPFITEEVV